MKKQNNLERLPDIGGIYLWTFQFKDGYLVYSAGITKSTKIRLDSKFRFGIWNFFLKKKLASIKNLSRKEND